MSATRTCIPIFRLLALSLCIWLLALCLPLTVDAAPSASLSGPDVLRAGDTLTLSLKLSGEKFYSFEGSISYDTGKLTYLSASGSLSGWTVDIETDTASAGTIKFIGIDDKLSAPISTRKTVLTVKFRVKSDLASGTTVRVRCQDITASDGDNDIDFPDTSWSLALSPPLSSDAGLASLSALETSLTPSFSSDVTEYTAASVPFGVESLTLLYKTSDADAKAEVSGNNLAVGDNTITVTVTAPNGNQRSYRITVEREQDPNYIPSADSLLNEIALSAGALSPAFSPERLQYLVTVPYETEQITILGSPRDKKAIGCDTVTASLKVGQNDLTLICRAEDGSTTSYRLYVLRMPEYGQYLPTVTPGAASPSDTAPTDTLAPGITGSDTAPESSSQTSSPSDDDTAAPPPVSATSPDTLSLLTDRSVLIALAATAAVMLGIGLVIGALAAKPKKYRYRR